MASPLIFLVAGEPSGDALGASLMDALSQETGGDIRFAGIGGPEMEARGLKSLFPMSDLAIMGLVEVLPRLAKVLRRIRETITAIQTMEPDAVVTIDAQDFSYRITRGLHPASFPVIHYVGPTVWAWKPWRAAKVATVVDRVLLLFPFEKPFWDAVGQDAVFVGHPIAEHKIDPAQTDTWRKRSLADRTGPLLAVLPGSRKSEVRRHLPLFRDVVENLALRHDGLAVVIPTVANVAETVKQQTLDWKVPVVVMEGDGDERRAAMAAADAAIAVSGTVALDLAAAGTPHVIAFRANPLTVAIVRWMIRVRFVSLVNLIADRQVTPELLQEYCHRDSLVAALEGLLTDPDAAQKQRVAMKGVISELSDSGESPSRLAARAVLECLGGNNA
ncbi:MAG: lipid-A-disaccharide synthase [Alphaproteobacteria bacterium]|jgi:lipid-A-disaccharide synthase|nr:lipid-A-disaccharide synthase [Rhodospirillaceae bacterium]MBT6204113.1 lipid-A-disaccharide synthase [Rhodospirillaceae bacterium]MBT6512897.1 lipid-A-disaccharide synthase [Rhodospirillaceae bacterium]MBT7646086.1 lipid-A-disaccharide synthase [Rhodospirillaceae bacterium]MDG2481120.1 lipid-A-disaccharide synthase [Alphaproteobacteria bacterium]